jgi:hypothetical protein
LKQVVTLVEPLEPMQLQRTVGPDQDMRMLAVEPLATTPMAQHLLSPPLRFTWASGGQQDLLPIAFAFTMEAVRFFR